MMIVALHPPTVANVMGVGAVALAVIILAVLIVAVLLRRP